MNVDLRLTVKLVYFTTNGEHPLTTHVEFFPPDTITVSRLKKYTWDQINEFCVQLGYIPYSWEIINIYRGPTPLLSSVSTRLSHV